MSLEDILVRLLNSRRRKAPSSSSGLYIGESRGLISGEQRPFSLPLREAGKHLFICGRTGYGKTTLILRFMYEHLKARIPLFFIDFHGSATDELLGMISSRAAGQVQSLAHMLSLL